MCSGQGCHVNNLKSSICHPKTFRTSNWPKKIAARPKSEIQRIRATSSSLRIKTVLNRNHSIHHIELIGEHYLVTNCSRWLINFDFHFLFSELSKTQKFIVQIKKETMSEIRINLKNGRRFCVCVQRLALTVDFELWRACVLAVSLMKIGIEFEYTLKIIAVNWFRRSEWKAVDLHVHHSEQKTVCSPLVHNPYSVI